MGDITNEESGVTPIWRIGEINPLRFLTEPGTLSARWVGADVSRIDPGIFHFSVCQKRLQGRKADFVYVGSVAKLAGKARRHAVRLRSPRHYFGDCSSGRFSGDAKGHLFGDGTTMCFRCDHRSRGLGSCQMSGRS